LRNSDSGELASNYVPSEYSSSATRQEALRGVNIDESRLPSGAYPPTTHGLTPPPLVYGPQVGYSAGVNTTNDYIERFLSSANQAQDSSYPPPAISQLPSGIAPGSGAGYHYAPSRSQPILAGYGREEPPELYDPYRYGAYISQSILTALNRHKSA